MNFNKLKKAAAAVTAAILSVSMLMGISVSAAEKSSTFSDMEMLSSTKYNPQYARLISKYMEKDTQKTIAYGKSKTKKFLDKYITADANDVSQYKFEITSENQLLSAVYCDSKIKMVMFDSSDNTEYAFYVDTKKVTVLNIEAKEKSSLPIKKSDFDELFDIVKYFPELLNDFDGLAGSSEKIKTYKFKSGKNVYYYEEIGEYNPTSFLFNEDGELLAIGDRSQCYCISVSFSVDDSDFVIPKEYKKVYPEDFDFDFDF